MPISNPLTDINGVLFDGDNDDTPGGNFYGLFALGKNVAFTDSTVTRVIAVDQWRWRDQRLARARRRHRSTERCRCLRREQHARGFGPWRVELTVYIGSVTIPVASPLTLNGATNDLPGSFVVLTTGFSNPPPPPTAASPTPVVATIESALHC